MGVLVDLDDRPETAASDTSHRFESETSILGGLTILDVQVFPKAFLDLISAPHVASRSKADRDDVSPPRFQTERLVKCPHAVDPAQRDIQLLGEIDQGLMGKIVIAILDRLENHDEILRVAVETTFYNPVQFHVIDVRSHNTRACLCHLVFSLTKKKVSLLRTSGLAGDRTVFYAHTASRAKVHVDAARTFPDFHLEIPRRSLDGFKVRVSDQLDIQMPADLDQFG
jgi:hypothetical protein